MQLFIKTLTGMTITLEVEPSELIESVKQRIQEKHGFPAEQQHLIFAGKEMRDERSIADCNVGKKSTIHMILQRIKILVNLFPTGNTITLSIIASDSILELKRLIQDKEGIPIDQQRLIFGDDELEDRRTIAYYNILQDSLIICECDSLPLLK
jgi:ubiquitin C